MHACMPWIDIQFGNGTIRAPVLPNHPLKNNNFQSFSQTESNKQAQLQLRSAQRQRTGSLHTAKIVTYGTES